MRSVWGASSGCRAVTVSASYRCDRNWTGFGSEVDAYQGWIDSMVPSAMWAAVPVWATGTSDSPSTMVLSDNGNVLVETPSGIAVWSSNTVI